MKIKVLAHCRECEAFPGFQTFERIVEFNDKNIYTTKCDEGHLCYTSLLECKFELLFDQGALALIDGYCKESVSSMAGALERFIEFFLRVIAVHKQISYQDFEYTWKLISAQSERQLGAFYFMQLSEWGSALFTLDSKKTEFRNKVIHKGYIPSSEEAIEYGEYVLGFIFNVLKKLRETHKDSIINAESYEYISKASLGDSIISRARSSIPTIIAMRSISDPNFGTKKFIDALKSVADNSFYKDFYKRGIFN